MFNTHLGLAYINHWLEVVNEHSLHNPFIFSIYNDVIRADSINENHVLIENWRNNLLKNEEFIDIIDLGAGSKASGQKKRSVNSIARSASSSPKFMRLLARLANITQGGNIIELGTSFGLSSCYLALESPKSSIYTFEGCKATAIIARKSFAITKSKNIELLEGNIDHELPEILTQVETIDFAYIDANHTYEATLKYFNLILEKVNDSSIMVFDDIHWSSEMSQAWREICKSNRITLSIDLFDAGVVFFKALEKKQHYVLNY